jgi:hypothetical protein
MSTVESRSIINAPVRRSLDVIQNVAHDLAETVADLAELVDKNAKLEVKHHIRSSWGVVGRGSFPSSSTVVGGGGSRNQLTNTLDVLFVQDRWYEVRCTIRAIAVSDADPDVIEPDDVGGMYAICNIAGADRGGGGQHVQVVATTQGAQFIWAFRCPTDIPIGQQPVVILVTNVRSTIPLTVYTDAGSQFIVRDVGTTLPPDPPDPLPRG